MPSKADLEREVKKIFQDQWSERWVTVVPEAKDFAPGNDAKKLNATVLYADMSDSTDLVDKHGYLFAAQIYKAYLRCAATIINNNTGKITAYDGDRVMAVFVEDPKDTAAVRSTKKTTAVRSAMQINYAVCEIINPLIKKVLGKKYQLNHVIGIDTSELFVTRIGVRNDSDLVWVGRAANYAAKLCSMNDECSLYITRRVFDSLDPRMKSNEWEVLQWEARNNMKIYGSNEYLPFD